MKKKARKNKKQRCRQPTFYQDADLKYDYSGVGSFGWIDMDFDDPIDTCFYTEERITRFGFY